MTDKENESFIEELNRIGEVRHGNAILKVSREGYHFRNARDVFSRLSHDLPAAASPERVKAHWHGFIANMRNADQL